MTQIAPNENIFIHRRRLLLRYMIGKMNVLNKKVRKESPSLMFWALLMLAISSQFYSRKECILSLTTSETKFRQTKMGKAISAQQREHWRTQARPWNSEICCYGPYNWSSPVTGWRTLWKIVLQPWGQNEKTSIFLKNVLPGFWTELCESHRTHWFSE